MPFNNQIGVCPAKGPGRCGHAGVEAGGLRALTVEMRARPLAALHSSWRSGVGWAVTGKSVIVLRPAVTKTLALRAPGNAQLHKPAQQPENRALHPPKLPSDTAF